MNAANLYRQNAETVRAIAERFATILAEWIGPEAMADVVRQNKALPPNVCASHDYCDANMAMHDAFRDVTGREPVAESPNDAALWCAAWDAFHLLNR